ncbi:cell division protein FtsZ [Azospirillum fermentarium]|uniref:cell division protein FtsZ n=1 Tax=Azospirillum fermentarium TaxID=1233114 RepID=UPI0022273339|nr:cell division protein FtsZ [Azospirillum fermentarium]MCW2246498.1 cell division protein FtsZ [Azospirillum fermentarium]
MINVTLPQIEPELKPRITVFGVGGAGGNAVNNMIKSNLEGVDFVVGNTDAQALKGSLCDKRLQLGTTVTRGLGAGSKPDIGRASAEEQIDEIVQYLEGSNMVFITAGMGGGTGTGAAPVIARAARERGILTVGVVTKPFHFEGAHRMRLAESGIAELQQYVDTLIIIPNQNLFRIANEKTTFADAFKMADDVLHSGVRGVTDLMVMPGLINLDFADIRSVMTEMGKAMMGTGEAGGERRAIEAAEAAISNPLLDDVSMKGARGVLINITGGYDMTLFEVDEAANRIRDEVDPDANIIFGSTFDSSLEGVMRVSVVATGIDAAIMANPRNAAGAAQAVNLSLVSDRSRKPAAPGLTGAAPAAAPIRAETPAQTAPKPQTIASAASAFVMEAPVAQTAAPHVAPHVADVAHPEPAPQPAPAYQTAAPQHIAHQAAPMEAPRPPISPLATERRDGAFIPPQPMDPGQRAPMAAPPVTMSAPPAPASQPQQHHYAEEPKKRQSLFSRVTGLGRRKEETPAEPPRQALPPVAPAVSAPPAAPQAQAPRVTVDPTPHGTKMASHEEDVLDIPAFLRRQAN